jgi:hypothetical protein
MSNFFIRLKQNFVATKNIFNFKLNHSKNKIKVIVKQKSNNIKIR